MFVTEKPVCPGKAVLRSRLRQSNHNLGWMGEGWVGPAGAPYQHEAIQTRACARDYCCTPLPGLSVMDSTMPSFGCVTISPLPLNLTTLGRIRGLLLHALKGFRRLFPLVLF